jgi:hypothetical protein
MYFINVEILPECRNPVTSMLLLRSFLDTIATLAENDIFFRRICTNDYTNDGSKLCRHFRMNVVGPHVEQGNILDEPFSTFLSTLLKSAPKLMAYYRETVRLYEASSCA